MEIRFRCPDCSQDLTAPASLIDQEIECPACGETIIVQDQTEILERLEAEALQAEMAAAAASMERTREEREPIKITASASKSLIQKPTAKRLEIAAKEAVHFHCKTLRHAELGDRFDAEVSKLLTEIGDGHLQHIFPIQYSTNNGSDYGVVVVYKDEI